MSSRTRRILSYAVLVAGVVVAIFFTVGTGALIAVGNPLALIYAPITAYLIGLLHRRHHELADRQNPLG